MTEFTDNFKTTDKLTRRQIFRSAIAAGVGVSAASNITVDDVRGADSDQVVISIDTEGNHKKYVPSDWHERVLDARSARDEIEQRFFDKEGVYSVGYSPGTHGGDNPHVVVGLNRNSDKKDERRGELPDRTNDTRIDIKEITIGKAHCDPEYLSGPGTPGGLQIYVFDNSTGNGYCSLTSRMINGSDQNWDFGWSTAAHCLQCPGNWDGTQRVAHKVDGLSREIGTVVLVDTNLDIAIIEKHDSPDELSEVARPDNPDATSLRHDIAGTASEDGLSDIDAMGKKFIQRGRSSCQIKGEITEINSSQLVDKTGKYCEWELENQVNWTGNTEEGDSGALVYSEMVDGNRYASHGHSGKPNLGDAYGPAGFAIRDQYNCWWDDL